MKVSIIGTGYIGLIQAVGLAKLGFEVVSIDVFEDKINKLKSGKATIYEDGLQELLDEVGENILFTTDISKISGSDVVFICVGTPQDANGKTDLSYIYGACKDIKPFLKGKEIIVIKSTVPVGTNKSIYNFFDKKISIVSNPEFLREGVAVKDFFNPDRIVLGFENLEEKNSIEKMYNLYAYFTEKEVEFITTNWETAELIKYSANSFLGTKITFINEIARLADKVGANIKDLSYAMGLDNRIGNKFLNAGIGYGGSCFPKDIKSLIHQFRENGLEGGIVSKVDEINDSQVDYFVKKILDKYDGNINSKVIGIVGVAFKPGTDDLRESKGIEVIKKLLFLGAKLKVFDYNAKALENFGKFIEGFLLLESRGFYTVEICDKFDNLVKGCDFIVITNEDESIKKENFSKIKLADKIIFDGRNILDKNELEKLGIKYIGVGV